MQRRLHVDGFLEVNDGKRDFTLMALGTRLQAEVGDVRIGVFSLLRMGVTMKRVRRLSRELVRRELTLVITRRGAPLAEVGAGVRGSFVARLFGLPHVRLSWRR